MKKDRSTPNWASLVNMGSELRKASQVCHSEEAEPPAMSPSSVATAMVIGRRYGSTATR